MVQGTTSDAGKSTLVAGLCRLLRREGLRVAPFKPQNMALNSFVTADGGEIGRAQALQALAAGVDPLSDMNPVLLKPGTDTSAQVILQGRVHGEMDARAYHAFKPRVAGLVQESFRRLEAAFDLVIVEGAGSPAEVNLREGDIANMGFALPARCPVVLVADIDRGGVLAHFVGTLACLDPPERDLVRGFVINRFRGDRALLRPGEEWLAARTGKPVYGVLRYLHGLHLDAEDAVQVGQDRAAAPGQRLVVAVPVYPRISNHTDLDALRAHPQVEVRFAGPGSRLPPADLVVLPGSRSVQADLRWLREQGWDEAIRRHVRLGGKVLGLCGGLQMLGRQLHDPGGLEGPAGSVAGLGLLDIESSLAPEKRLARVTGHLQLPGGAPVAGYEIHLGTTRGPGLARPAVVLDGVADGAISDDGQVMGTYLHGLFDEPSACEALLAWAGLAGVRAVDYRELRERSLDRLADEVAEGLDVRALLRDTAGPALATRLGERAARA